MVELNVIFHEIEWLDISLYLVYLDNIAKYYSKTEYHITEFTEFSKQFISSLFLELATKTFNS